MDNKNQHTPAHGVTTPPRKLPPAWFAFGSPAPINAQRDGDVTFLPVARAREVAVQLPRPWPVHSPVLTAQVGVPTGMKMNMIVGTGVTAGTVAMRVGGVGETEGTVGWGKV
jgi:hypothetical protein